LALVLVSAPDFGVRSEPGVPDTVCLTLMVIQTHFRNPNVYRVLSPLTASSIDIIQVSTT
jgi:hypothetical protein